MTSRTLILVTALFVLQCKTPNLPSGVIECGEGDCPEGMSCASDGLCYSGLPEDGEAPRVDAGAGEMPGGAVLFFRGACPDGWSEFSLANGRTIVGAVAQGTPGATVGEPLGPLGKVVITEPLAHSHVVNLGTNSPNGSGNHSHILDDARQSDDTDAGSSGVQQVDDNSGDSTANADDEPDHNHTLDIPSFDSETVGSDEVDVTMPYIHLRACRRN